MVAAGRPEDTKRAVYRVPYAPEVFYRGANILMLWAAAIAKGYNCPLWLAHKQAAELDGQIRKGEKGSLTRTPSPRPAPTSWARRLKPKFRL